MKLKRHDWESIVQQYEGCDLSVVEFCKRMGVPTSGFYENRKKFASQKKKPVKQRPAPVKQKLVAVKVSNEPIIPDLRAPSIRIKTRHGAEIEVFV